MREQRGEGLLVALRAPRAARGRQPAAGRTAADVAQVHVTDALNGPLAPADRDGPVRKPFSNWTVAVRTRDGAPRAC